MTETPSEWAMEKAFRVQDEYLSFTGDDAIDEWVQAGIARALDAARAEGRREALESLLYWLEHDAPMDPPDGMHDRAQVWLAAQDALEVHIRALIDKEAGR